jgi:hypothetical protein
MIACSIGAVAEPVGAEAGDAAAADERRTRRLHARLVRLFLIWVLFVDCVVLLLLLFGLSTMKH